MKRIEKTRFFSWKIGTLAEGCRLCVKGRKLVLYVTGLCSRKCYYCPLSDERKDKDRVWANERPIKKVREIIEESLISKAKGAGITGGDPLIRIERTTNYIKTLKKRFGKKFHIHLYAPMNLVDETRLKRLYSAGLDEIRFHPGLEKEKEWERILLAKRYRWKIGVEIPVIPGKEEETKKLIEFINGKVDFLNLNELEVSDTNANKLIEKGFTTKDNISYGIKGSEEMAMKILGYCLKNNINVHYCTGKLKDRVQLGNRIKIRADSVKKRYDTVTNEGMLIRGVIYLDETIPGFNYKKNIERIDKDKKEKEKMIRKLKRIKKNIMEEYRIKNGLIDIDKEKFRVLIDQKILKKIYKNIKEKCAIVSEYPTYDKMIVDVSFLN